MALFKNYLERLVQSNAEADVIIGLGDYARWKRVGIRDSNSLGFDCVADLDSSSGTAVAVDNSAEWLFNTGGYSSGVLNVVGVYSFFIRISGANSPATSSFYFYDDSASQIDIGINSGAGIEVGNVSELLDGIICTSFSLYVSDRTHFDAVYSLLDASAEILLIVQKIG